MHLIWVVCGKVIPLFILHTNNQDHPNHETYDKDRLTNQKLHALFAHIAFKVYLYRANEYNQDADAKQECHSEKNCRN